MAVQDLRFAIRSLLRSPLLAGAANVSFCEIQTDRGRDAVLLDTAGKWMMEDTSGWEQFLQHLKEHRAECPINGLLLMVPAPSLISDNIPGAMGGGGGLLAGEPDRCVQLRIIRRQWGTPIQPLDTAAFAAMVPAARGDEAECRRHVHAALAASERGRLPALAIYAGWPLGLLELGLGHVPAAGATRSEGGRGRQPRTTNWWKPGPTRCGRGVRDL